MIFTLWASITVTVAGTLERRHLGRQETDTWKAIQQMIDNRLTQIAPQQVRVAFKLLGTSRAAYDAQTVNVRIIWDIAHPSDVGTTISAENVIIDAVRQVFEEHFAFVRIAGLQFQHALPTPGINLLIEL